jgi:DNA-binding GntR family transcriptional regulator
LILFTDSSTGLSGCRLQERMLRNLFDLLYLKYGGSYLFSTSMDAADTDHIMLFSKIKSGDAKGARQVLSRHIRRVKDHVVKNVDKMLSATRF